MFNLPLALFVVFSTLALIGGVFLGYFAIRKRLVNDPDLQEFIERVDAGHAEQEAAQAGTAKD